MNNQYSQDLQKFRNQIDSIDEEIISLLDKRIGIVGEVAKLKQQHQEGFFIKSAREADMIKKILSRSDLKFSKTAIVSIWRKIITASNICEQPISIGMQNPKNSADYTYIVKEYYSEQVPIHLYDSATNLIAAMEKKQIQIAIFELPKDLGSRKEDVKENWWISMANNKFGMKVYAKLPFVKFSGDDKDRNQPQLFLVAVKEAEKSLEDNTLLYVEANKEVSRSQILTLLKEQGLQGNILKSVSLQQVDGIVFYLIEISGFYLESDSEIKELSKAKMKPYVKVLGHYPLEVRL